MEKTPTPTPSDKAASRRGLTRDATVAAICGFVVVLMVGASYAAVPFYNWFCRATGFRAAGAHHRGAVRFQRGRRIAVEVRAGADRNPHQDRPGRHRLLHRDQP